VLLLFIVILLNLDLVLVVVVVALVDGSLVKQKRAATSNRLRRSQFFSLSSFLAFSLFLLEPNDAEQGDVFERKVRKFLLSVSHEIFARDKLCLVVVASLDALKPAKKEGQS